MPLLELHQPWSKLLVHAAKRREAAEIKHGRVAMMAALGAVLLPCIALLKIFWLPLEPRMEVEPSPEGALMPCPTSGLAAAQPQPHNIITGSATTLMCSDILQQALALPSADLDCSASCLASFCLQPSCAAVPRLHRKYSVVLSMQLQIKDLDYMNYMSYVLVYM